MSGKDLFVLVWETGRKVSKCGQAKLKRGTKYEDKVSEVPKCSPAQPGVHPDSDQNLSVATKKRKKISKKLEKLQHQSQALRNWLNNGKENCEPECGTGELSKNISECGEEQFNFDSSILYQYAENYDTCSSILLDWFDKIKLENECGIGGHSQGQPECGERKADLYPSSENRKKRKTVDQPGEPEGKKLKTDQV